MRLDKTKLRADTMPPPVTITSVEFRNFKALEHYSVKFQHMNILVGPNNCGKSTVLGAFRALVAGLRRARSRNPENVHGPDGIRRGYSIAPETLPISVENVHTDYADTDTTVKFRLSNGNKLILYFPQEQDRGCILIPETEGKPVISTTTFKNAFPITIGITPVLGPVEHEEALLAEETVRRDLVTHRASRQFRNFWHYYPDGFEDFAKLVSKTWPGMAIEPPRRVDATANKLAMFCVEKRIPRELYWAGFGFQIWCQLLTHIARSSNDSILIIDEPEVYLHPDVQRHLLGILRDAGPDIIIATHSTEIMGDADPSEILLIDKSKKSAERLRDIEGVQAALDLVGSVQNITLTQLARNRRILFVEGVKDFKILRRFAHKVELLELSSGFDLTPVESEGFSSWERIRALSWGLEKTLGDSLRIGAIFDRDYWSSEEVETICAELNHHLDFSHIHARKEIENYLLVPEILDRAMKKAVSERARRLGEEIVEPEPAIKILERITNSLRSATQAQYISKRARYLKHSGRDEATIGAETIELFDSKWMNIDTRMEIVPGKDVLRAFREEMQTRYSISLTDHKIIDEFRFKEIPTDLISLLNKLEEYRTRPIRSRANED
jgi:energy-coupling factor transporter ATP-binding protein EcfA2